MVLIKYFIFSLISLNLLFSDYVNGRRELTICQLFNAVQHCVSYRYGIVSCFQCTASLFDARQRLPGAVSVTGGLIGDTIELEEFNVD